MVNIKRFDRVPTLCNRKVSCVPFEEFEQIFSPSITDQSYFSPSSEVNKLVGNATGNYNGVFDSGDVDVDVVRMRKPGMDITEVTEIVKRLDSEARFHAENDYADAKDKADAKSLSDAQSQAQSDFISNLMNNSNTDK